MRANKKTTTDQISANGKLRFAGLALTVALVVPCSALEPATSPSFMVQQASISSSAANLASPTFKALASQINSGLAFNRLQSATPLPVRVSHFVVE